MRTDMQPSRAMSQEQLDNLRRLAETVVSTFGTKCEIAIHDFAFLPHSLVHIAGNVTNRRMGASITDLVLKALRKHGDAATDMVAYRTTTRDGKVLRSSTTFIRNADGEVVGAFCINYDVGGILETLATLEQIAGVPDPTAAHEPAAETFTSHLNETVGVFLEQYSRKVGRQPRALTREERLALIRDLETQGVFLVKGAVDIVAKALGVTKSTVYSYVKETRSDAG